MLSILLIAATHWMLLHGPENQSYWINMDQISTLRQPIPNDLRESFARGVKCIIVTTNGKFVAVTESCEVVYQLIAGVK